MKSQFTQTVRNAEAVVLWHSLFGNPLIVSVETIAFLEGFSAPSSLSFQIGKKPSSKNRRAVNELVRNRYLIPNGFDERAFLETEMRRREPDIVSGSLIDHLELIMSEACNFRCTYCIHFNNLEKGLRLKGGRRLMTFDVAKRSIDEYLRILRKHGKRIANINFGGGEPLLAWSTIGHVLEYCRASYEPEFEFNFSINTNASLITEEIAESLKEHHVKVASSLDGLRKGNDLVRISKSGCGTFDAVVHGFSLLAGAGWPLDGFAVTLTEKNFLLLDESVIDWAASRGMQNVRIDVDVLSAVGLPLDDIVEKLLRIRRYARKREIDVPGFWARPAENMNASTLTSRVAFCGGVRGNSVCINPSGEIYVCGYSEILIGHLQHFDKLHETNSSYHRLVSGRRSGSMEMCRGCEIEGQCGGGCQITQEYARKTGTSKINRMCDFYRRMTREILLEQLREALA